MKRTWLAARLGSLAVIALAGMMSLSTAEASKKEDSGDTTPTDNPAWSDPMVQGIVLSTYWVDSKNPGQRTAVIEVWSNEADLRVTIYGDDPSVRDAIVSGRACVGRFVVVTGDRIDEDELVGRGIQVPDQPNQCTATIPPTG